MWRTEDEVVLWHPQFLGKGKKVFITNKSRCYMTHNEALIRWGGQFSVSCLTLKCHVFHEVILWWYCDIWIWRKNKNWKCAVSDKLVNDNKSNRQPFNCSTSKNSSLFSTRLWMLARGKAVCSLIHLYFHWEDILIIENMNEEKLAKNEPDLWGKLHIN